ncbi:hypothetical protein PVAP13_2KG235400 [Panicum virgatum]|uniref:Uncharacterized protein n=1 Tax=Panicum virgatum TaxID=38727 RepID=A0A8T0W8L9_PANVG|nr:hypothetical protein PVAP13_2KG235400 [Panicum virgatum]
MQEALPCCSSTSTARSSSSREASPKSGGDSSLLHLHQHIYKNRGIYGIARLCTS